MHVSRRALLLGIAASGAAIAARPAAAADEARLDVAVPLDHDRPDGGSFPLACEWGAPRIAGRPTILVVADAQQFFVRPGGAARLQGDLFGDAVNVLAITGRSRAPEIGRLVMTSDAVDWATAYRLLNWRQWARDILAVVERLQLGAGELGLYGRSGGAHLIHQLLALRPDLEARAYVQAAVNHELDVRWGLGADRTWPDFAAREPDLAGQVMARIAGQPERRRELVLILQRQHFFEPLEGLPAARVAAIRAFLADDAAALAEMRGRYQIDAIARTRGTPEGVGSMVRIYEFAAPHADPRGRADRLQPDVEALYFHADPLGDEPLRPAVPATDWTRLRNQSATVLQVAGRHDHTCDYRTQIGLAGLTRGSNLLLLDDDHVFRRWGAQRSQAGLLQAYFTGGVDSAAYRAALAAVEPLRWREG